MATCFLYVQHLTETSCLSLSLDQQGKVAAPLLERDFNEIKTLQKNCQTILVLPTQRFSLHRITLPWLAEKKARAALPFALEDKLAQNVNSLHFAFDRNHYQDGQYLVVVGDKTYLEELIARFDALEINFDSITLDWFALNQQEIAVLNSCLLVNKSDFQGAVSSDLADFFLNQPGTTSEEYSFYVFPDSNQTFLPPQQGLIKEISDDSHVWLAQRLKATKLINLCQGELEHGGSQSSTKRWYQAAILMSLLWVIALLGTNAIRLYYLNKEAATVETQIAAIYHEFFPQAQQVISPKFRITQLLKANQNNSDMSFWTLLNILAKASKNSPMNVEQVRFQNQTLLVTLTTKNFEELESLQTHLQKMNIKVRQTQASTENKKVLGTLELSL
ncbi:type II secretion system protein GspL [Legionella cardiaca]|uniref:Type II secretion system protein L n=1 Tax=Legionella cardiaca TaxID=1071983 RepID=A0ABY8AN67_9GAMM|nr:type II secretion system protein GspL [Legionella cardiaca]WED42092.1 type II secretion system protein GspL [Legionella cardiaca]